MIRKPRLLFGLIPVLAVAAGLLTGCPAQEPEGGTAPSPGAPATSGTPAGGAAPSVELTAASTGEEIYQAKCQGCHGAKGAGGSAPSLAHEAGEPAAELRNVIETGEGKMPAFKGQLTSEQIDRVVEYVKSLGT